jgi:hypothetical protein
MRAIHLNLLLLAILLITIRAQGWSAIGGIRTGTRINIQGALL